MIKVQRYFVTFTLIVSFHCSAERREEDSTAPWMSSRNRRSRPASAGFGRYWPSALDCCLRRLGLACWAGSHITQCYSSFAEARLPSVKNLDDDGPYQVRSFRERKPQGSHSRRRTAAECMSQRRRKRDTRPYVGRAQLTTQYVVFGRLRAAEGLEPSMTAWPSSSRCSSGRAASSLRRVATR